MKGFLTRSLYAVQDKRAQVVLAGLNGDAHEATQKKYHICFHRSNLLKYIHIAIALHRASYKSVPRHTTCATHFALSREDSKSEHAHFPI